MSLAVDGPVLILPSSQSTAGMAAGLAKKGARGGKRLGSRAARGGLSLGKKGLSKARSGASSASSRLGVGGLAAGVPLIGGDERQASDSNDRMGIGAVVSDDPSNPSAVASTPDDIDRVARPDAPTQADRAPDPTVDDWDTYVEKAGGDEGLAFEMRETDRLQVAQQREIDQLRAEIQDGDNKYLTAATGGIATTMGGEAIKWAAGGFVLSGGNPLGIAGGVMAGLGYGAVKGGALGVLGKSAESVVDYTRSTGSVVEGVRKTGGDLTSEANRHVSDGIDDIGTAVDRGKEKVPFIGSEQEAEGINESTDSEHSDHFE